MNATKLARNLYGSGALIALMTGAAPGWTQTSPAPTAPAPASAPPVASQSAAASAPGDIIVTAQRRSENVQSVPIAITAFSQKTLEQKSIYGAFDLNKAVPGLAAVSDQANGALPQFAIRGRGQSYGAASGSVETYFADVPLSPPFESPTLPPQFFDLQSVQILKGPQGTLFGRNSTGGAVLFVPQAPTDKFEGYIRAQGGNYGDVQIEGAINVPLGDDAALRVAGFKWSRNGYAKSFEGSTDYFGRVLPSQTINNQDVTEIRATLLWKPTDRLTNSTIATYHTDNDRGSLQAQYYANPDVGGVNQAPIPAGDVEPGVTPRRFYTNVDLHHPASQVWAAINTTTYELGNSLTIKNIFAHIDASGVTSNPSDYDGSGYNPTNNPFNISNLETGLQQLHTNHNYQTTDEVQLQGHAFDNKLDFIGGGLIDITRQPGSANNINYTDVTYSYGTTPAPINENFGQANYSSKSLFGSLTLHASDKLTFIGGVRHVWDDVHFNSYSTYGTTVTSSVPGTTYDAVTGTYVPTVESRRHQNFQGWAYNAGAEFRPSSATMIYGGYRRGYKRGGFNTNVQILNQAAFKPETDDDFYLGVKQSLSIFGVPGHINVEGFDDIYHDAQRYFLGVSNGSLNTVVVNAQKSTFRGVDMDFTIDPAKWLSLSGNYTFVDSKYNKFTDQSEPAAVFAAVGNPSNDLSSNPVGLVSRNKFSLTARLHEELSDGGDIAFAPTVNYQSKFYADDYSKRVPLSDALIGGSFSGVGQIDLGAHGLDTIPGYATVDLRLEWNKVRGSNFDLAMNVNNLTNKTYKLIVNGLYLFGVQAAIYGPPRLVTFDVRFHF